MPTVPLYVPVNTARRVAARAGIEPDGDLFLELIRSLCADALDTEAGITHPVVGFRAECGWAKLHRAGHRCRHCGGSS